MANTELADLLDDLERGYEGDAWHGSPLRAILEGITAEVATARPIPGGHTIAELVAHLGAWEGVVVRRIEERVAIEEPDEGNFPAVGSPGFETWDAILVRLADRHDRLSRCLSGLDPARLRETVAGKDYSVAHMIRGVAQHMAYHAGQVATLRKAVESRTAAPRP